MTIKEVAERTGIATATLRYYESIGLIPPVPRNINGVRVYNEDIVAWIEFTLHFKAAGIQLDSIKTYIDLAMQGDSTRVARKKIIEEARNDIVLRIKKLEKILEFTNYKLDYYYSDIVPKTETMVKELKQNKNVSV